MKNFHSIKEKVVKEIIQHLIVHFLGKNYVLVHRKAYSDLLKYKLKELK